MKSKVEFFKSEDFINFDWQHSLAERANAILSERGVVVYGCDDYKKYPEMKDKVWGWSEEGLGHDTHTALLINIQPIDQLDTAESLLREWVEEHEKFKPYEGDIYERAKKLLGEK